MTLVSAIVPTFNGAAYLGAALDSILGQDHAELEVIVCDDGSTDATLEVLARYEPRVRVLRQANAGVSAARNRAAAAARGEYLAFLDQDDLWDPDFVTTQLVLLERSPDHGLAYADSRTIDAEGEVRGLRSTYLRFAEGKVFDALLEGNFIPIETLLVRTNLFRSLGGFRTDYRLLEDYELCLRAARSTRVALTPRPLASYRVHASNVTHDMQGILEEYVRVLEDLALTGSDLSPDEHARMESVLARRHGELAWYALRRVDLAEAARHMQLAPEGLPVGLRLKVGLLAGALRVLPSPVDRALVGLLPRRRMYGV